VAVDVDHGALIATYAPRDATPRPALRRLLRHRRGTGPQRGLSHADSPPAPAAMVCAALPHCTPCQNPVQTGMRSEP
jgi:hypothetical protein